MYVYTLGYWEDGMGWAVMDSSIIEHKFLSVYRTLFNFFSALGLVHVCTG
jgi:hypothetical protein